MPSDFIAGGIFVSAFAKEVMEQACIARSRGIRACRPVAREAEDATVRGHARIRRGAWVPRCRPRRGAARTDCRFEGGGNVQLKLDR